jgi:tetratricopeptide (TPR) repeat protein
MVVMFFDRRGLWHDWVKVQTIAASAARRVGDREGQAHALNGLGLGYARSGRPDDAKPHYEDAVALFAAIGDQVAEARTHLNLASVLERLGQLVDAVRHATRPRPSVPPAIRAGKRARSTRWAGSTRCVRPRTDPALQRAGPHLHQEAADRLGEAAAWDSLASPISTSASSAGDRLLQQRLTSFAIPAPPSRG